MRFALSQDQRDFAAALDALLGDADVSAISRAWAEGDSAPGLALWSQLADTGVTAVAVPDRLGGIGGDAVDVAVVFGRLGYHAVPGPAIETVALAPALLVGSAAEPLLEQVASGATLVSVAAPPLVPRALDADVAGQVLVVADDGVHVGQAGVRRESVDPTRRIFEVGVGDLLATVPAAQIRTALDTATLACAATLAGAGDRLLTDTVAYAASRQQFGKVIGSYQAVKHQLADVRIALDFARPLLHGAALGLAAGTADASRDVSAALVTCADAAYLASRVALQVHGAIGYTTELDLSRWILKVRALVSAWGTPADHRARVLDALTGG